jgi:hypothetical protein
VKESEREPQAGDEHGHCPSFSGAGEGGVVGALCLREECNGADGVPYFSRADGNLVQAV